MVRLSPYRIPYPPSSLPKTWFRQLSLEHLRWDFVCSTDVARQVKTCLGRCLGRSRWLGVDRVRTPTRLCWWVLITNAINYDHCLNSIIWSLCCIPVGFHIFPSYCQKLGSDSSPLNISGETSSTLQMLVGRVKPIWAGAQGDCTSWASTEWEPLSTRLCRWVFTNKWFCF